MHKCEAKAADIALFGNRALYVWRQLGRIYEVPMTLFEENAAILRNMEADGSDLGPPRSIDFSHVFPDRASADAFAHEAQRAGFSTDIQEVEHDEDPWDVTASKEMTPTCEDITKAEEQLDTLARSHRGRADGWGFFRV